MQWLAVGMDFELGCILPAEEGERVEDTSSRRCPAGLMPEWRRRRSVRHMGMLSSSQTFAHALSLWGRRVAPVGAVSVG